MSAYQRGNPLTSRGVEYRFGVPNCCSGRHHVIHHQHSAGKLGPRKGDKARALPACGKTSCDLLHFVHSPQERNEGQPEPLRYMTRHFLRVVDAEAPPTASDGRYPSDSVHTVQIRRAQARRNCWLTKAGSDPAILRRNDGGAHTLVRLAAHEGFRFRRHDQTLERASDRSSGPVGSLSSDSDPTCRGPL